MPRKLTTYKQPSILTRIEGAASVEELGALRQAIGFHVVHGRIDPSEHTARKWHEAMLAKIVLFIREAKTDREAAYVFNTVFTWYSRPVQEWLRALVTKVAAPMPRAADA